MYDLAAIEKEIEDALWDNLPLAEAAKRWREAEGKLLAIPSESPGDVIKERDRILSYCLLRQIVEEPFENLRKMQRSLEYALRSGDKVQIMRAYGSLSGASRVCKDFSHAQLYLEKQMNIMESFSDEERHTYDVQQGYGWYHIFWAKLHFDKGEYKQALASLERALSILTRIENYSGIKRIWAIRSDCYRCLGRDGDAMHADNESRRFARMSKQYRR